MDKFFLVIGSLLEKRDQNNRSELPGLATAEIVSDDLPRVVNYLGISGKFSLESVVNSYRNRWLITVGLCIGAVFGMISGKVGEMLTSG